MSQQRTTTVGEAAYDTHHAGAKTSLTNQIHSNDARSYNNDVLTTAELQIKNHGSTNYNPDNKNNPQMDNNTQTNNNNYTNANVQTRDYGQMEHYSQTDRNTAVTNINGEAVTNTNNQSNTTDIPNRETAITNINGESVTDNNTQLNTTTTQPNKEAALTNVNGEPINDTNTQLSTNNTQPNKETALTNSNREAINNDTNTQPNNIQTSHNNNTQITDNIQNENKTQINDTATNNNPQTIPNDNHVNTVAATANTTSDQEPRHWKMGSLLEHACAMAETYISPNSNINNSNLLDELKSAKGVMFARYWKGGLLFSGSKGSGILLSRVKNGWSGPCAINLQGISIGFDIGFETIDYILILHDESAFRMFQNKGALHIGASGEISAGSFDKDVNRGLAKSTITNAISVHTFSKGAFIGLSIAGTIISIKDDCNKQYYGHPIKLAEIVNNKIQPPDNAYYSRLISLLDQFTSNTNM